jgi:hypothetical protein
MYIQLYLETIEKIFHYYNSIQGKCLCFCTTFTSEILPLHVCFREKGAIEQILKVCKQSSIYFAYYLLKLRF